MAGNEKMKLLLHGVRDVGSGLGVVFAYCREVWGATEYAKATLDEERVTCVECLKEMALLKEDASSAFVEWHRKDKELLKKTYGHSRIG